mmetsp:Transcript_39158/g.91230  ORF Transcript_39158/g.91230 Transcript_39158/m.91230 type:complete len:698 (-) Transcript_39158:99-2192(-)
MLKRNSDQKLKDDNYGLNESWAESCAMFSTIFILAAFLTAILLGLFVGIGVHYVLFIDDLNETLNVCHTSVIDSKNFSYDSSDNYKHGNGSKISSIRQLSIDLKNVSPSFLKSEKRLVEAMNNAIGVDDFQKFTGSSHNLISNCHQSPSKGVSCVGVMPEKTIALTTWPNDGVISLFIISTDSSDLTDYVDDVKGYFGIPADSTLRWENVQMMWTHHILGSYSKKNLTNIELEGDIQDFYFKFLTHELKKKVASVQTKFQKIDVYDFIDPKINTIGSLERSVTNDGSYESLHPEFFKPNRIVFLDGVQQSTSIGDAQYHEALVHPAMFTHGAPKRVAIIGGGEGATLREVLKHQSVDYVAMIEIDEIMVNASKEHLPSWSDCSDLIGSSESCMDDPRADVYYEDAMRWFIDRFSPECDCSSGQEHRHFCECDDETYDSQLPKDGHETIQGEFDVVIMDALDPTDDNAFTEYLYYNDRFLESMFDSLTENGVIIMQLGDSIDLDDAHDAVNGFHTRANVIRVLERYGFESFHVYDEDHCGFFYPWSYVLACKKASCRQNFYRNEAEVNVAIHNKMIRTKSGRHPLKYFDGFTMGMYQTPSRPWQESFCRNTTNSQLCDLGFYNGKSQHDVDEDLNMLSHVVGNYRHHNISDAIEAEFFNLETKVMNNMILLKRSMEERIKTFLGKFNPIFARHLHHIF